MKLKMRLVGWNVQPIIMADDGENLMPVQSTGDTILAADWATFKDGGDEAALERLRKEIEG